MAFPNDSSRITDGIASLEASVPTYGNAKGSLPAARSLIRRTYLLQTLPVGAAAANVIVANSGPAVFFKQPGRVMGVTIQPGSAVLGNISNFLNYAVRAVSNVGAIGNTIAIRSTNDVASGGTGNLVAGQQFNLTVDAANARVGANTWVGLHIGITTGGIAGGACTWAIDVEEEGPDLYAV